MIQLRIQNYSPYERQVIRTIFAHSVSLPCNMSVSSFDKNDTVCKNCKNLCVCNDFALALDFINQTMKH